MFWLKVLVGLEFYPIVCTLGRRDIFTATLGECSIDLFCAIVSWILLLVYESKVWSGKNNPNFPKKLSFFLLFLLDI